MKNNVDTYEDIIHLPHHVSISHSSMSILDRAAQFSPFAALSGYDAAVKETARWTDTRMELGEDKRDILLEKLCIVQDAIDERPEISVTYFEPDARKAGGTYVTITGRAKKVDDVAHILCMTDGLEIALGEIVEIEGALLRDYFDEVAL